MSCMKKKRPGKLTYVVPRRRGLCRRLYWCYGNSVVSCTDIITVDQYQCKGDQRDIIRNINNNNEKFKS